MSKILNSSEAVYGFAAWLTSRKEKIVLSANNDAAPICELIKQFCSVNNLPDVSSEWPNNLIHPFGEVAVPGTGCNSEN